MPDSCGRGRHSDCVPCAWAGPRHDPGFLPAVGSCPEATQTPVARAVEAGTRPVPFWFLLDVLRSCVTLARCTPSRPPGPAAHVAFGQPHHPAGRRASQPRWGQRGQTLPAPCEQWFGILRALGDPRGAQRESADSASPCAVVFTSTTALASQSRPSVCLRSQEGSELCVRPGWFSASSRQLATALWGGWDHARQTRCGGRGSTSGGRLAVGRALGPHLSSPPAPPPCRKCQ